MRLPRYVSPTLGPVAVLTVLTLFAWPERAAQAQDYEAAGRHYTLATQAFGHSDFAAAAQEFKAAYDITKDPLVLANIGESYDRAGDGAQAVQLYRQYITESPTTPDRAAVEKRIAELEAALHLPPPAPAAAAAEPAPAAAPEKAATPPEAVVAPTPAAAKTDEEPATPMRVAGWIGVAATVVLLTTGAIFGLVAQERSDEISRQEITLGADNLPQKYTPDLEATITGLRSDGLTYNAAGIGLMAASGATAILSAVLFAVDYKHGSEKAPQVRLAPTFSSQGAGMAASLRF